MTFNGENLREVMGRFATGVTVVTTCQQGQLYGMTANAVTSLSLDPPLVLVAVDKKNSMLENLEQGKCFAVNILNSDQQKLSEQFANSGPKDFSNLSLKNSKTGAPVLRSAIAYVDCCLTEVLPGGDHLIFIGEVVEGDVNQGSPLIFYRGKYDRLAENDSANA